MDRTGSAVWQGGLKGGSGTVSTESGAVSGVQYSFGKRFEDEPGTNPEELIGAALGSCFSMFLAGQLEQAGMTAEEISTDARVTLEKVEGGFGVTRIHLVTRARAPGGGEDAFRKAVDASKAGCPISKLLKAEITVDAQLQS